MDVVEEKHCRVCKGELSVVLDLGKICVSDFYSIDYNYELKNPERVPLVLTKCLTCGLVQLKHTVNLDDMYRNYWYRSNLNASMVKDLQDIVTQVEEYVRLVDGDIVLDIGCNDGTLLSLYKNKNLYKIGYDPALNLKEQAEKNCNYFINDYFSADKYPFADAKVITAVAMFYDLPDPNKFLKDIYSILEDNGILILQLTDLTSMLKVNAFDNICHEHLEYYKLLDIIKLLDANDFYAFHVEYNNVNGKSIRILATKYGSRFVSDNSVNDSIFNELDYFIENPLESFSEKINEIKNKVVNFIKIFPKEEVYALGASTKGNTLLQYFGLNNMDISAIGEINKDKLELFTVGTNIPIIPEEEVFKNHPKLIVILPWHFEETFEMLTRDYRRKGGLVLFPLPEPYIITDNGGYFL